MSAPDPVLDVRGVSVVYPGRRRARDAKPLTDVSLSVGHGETVGLVGESGSGKTTLARAILGLVAVESGTIEFEGEQISTASRRRRRELGARLQVVFQDPYSSLNPVKTIGQTLLEPLRIHQSLTRKDGEARIGEMLERVGLPAAAADRYPSQFSGGQRQRIAIARALMVSPRLIVCDEPVSALDLSIQAQIINLLVDLQREFSLSLLFVAHDLAVVRSISHRIVVLDKGRIVESGPARRVYAEPENEYTRKLLAAAPVPDPSAQRRRRERRQAARATPTANGAGPDAGR